MPNDQISARSLYLQDVNDQSMIALVSDCNWYTRAVELLAGTDVRKGTNVPDCLSFLTLMATM